MLAGAAALLIVAVHGGPAGGDSVTMIPDQHGSTVADIVALAVLGFFVAALLAHFLREVRQMRSDPASR